MPRGVSESKREGEGLLRGDQGGSFVIFSEHFLFRFFLACESDNLHPVRELPGGEDLTRENQFAPSLVCA